MAEAVTTKNEAAPSLNEMAAFLESSGDKTDVKLVDNTVQVEDAETENASPDGDEGQVVADEAGDDSSGVEAKADMEGEESKDDAAALKAPKLSQRAKLRAKLEETEKIAQHVSSERNQAVEIANEWRTEAEHWKTQFEALLNKAKKEYGHAEDPREIELVETKRKLAAVEREKTLQKQREDHQVKQHLMSVKTQLVETFTQQAQEAAAKFPGLTPQKILAAYAGTQEAGEDVEIMDVARQLASLSAVSKNRHQHAATRQHLETSNSAPRVINGRGGKRPDYEPTIDGMEAYLKSLKG